MAEITIRNLQKKVRPDRKKIKNLLRRVLIMEKCAFIKEVNVCLAGDRMIKKINASFAGKNNPTDVLSFGSGEKRKGRCAYADIIVSIDTARRNARIFHTSWRYETNLYCVHGLLHILGYNDDSKKNSAVMRKKENLYVNT